MSIDSTADFSASSQPQFRLVTPAMLAVSALWVVIYLTFFPNPGELFARNGILLLVGVAGAFIGNATAIGGGLVFIPVMMFVYHLDPVSSLKLAFVTQAVGMTSGAAGWIKRKEVPFSALKYTVPSLVLGTAISTFVFHPSGILVKSVFGPIALLTGLLTLVLMNWRGTTNELPARAALPLFLISVLGGLITGWVAIGEGEIIAAFCMIAYGLNTNRAIGLGVVLLSINSILLALAHSLYFGGVPWDMAIFTMGGVIWGGRLGAYVTQFVPAKPLKRTFAWIAIFDGLLTTIQAASVLL